METFFGEPVPPAVAPFGYWLDYVVAPGGIFLGEKLEENHGKMWQNWKKNMGT
jgi:hypothetical protein